MKILLKQGDTLKIELEDTDGEFLIVYDYVSLRVVADLPDDQSRVGIIYEENWKELSTKKKPKYISRKKEEKELLEYGLDDEEDDHESHAIFGGLIKTEADEEDEAEARFYWAIKNWSGSETTVTNAKFPRAQDAYFSIFNSHPIKSFQAKRLKEPKKVKNGDPAWATSYIQDVNGWMFVTP